MGKSQMHRILPPDLKASVIYLSLRLEGNPLTWKSVIDLTVARHFTSEIIAVSFGMNRLQKYTSADKILIRFWE